MKNFPRLIFFVLPAFIFSVSPAAHAASAHKSTACTNNPSCGEFIEFFDVDDRAGLDIFRVPSNAAKNCLRYGSGRYVTYVQPDGSLVLTCTAARWP
jgi:hypothetical protein